MQWKWRGCYRKRKKKKKRELLSSSRLKRSRGWMKIRQQNGATTRVYLVTVLFLCVYNIMMTGWKEVERVTVSFVSFLPDYLVYEPSALYFSFFFSFVCFFVFSLQSILCQSVWTNRNRIKNFSFFEHWWNFG